MIGVTLTLNQRMTQTFDLTACSSCSSQVWRNSRFQFVSSYSDSDSSVTYHCVSNLSFPTQKMNLFDLSSFSHISFRSVH